MTTLRIIRADESSLGERRLRAAMERYGFPHRFGSVARDIQAGTGVVVIADVGDDDPDADIVVYFHREPDDPPGRIWVVQLWSRSARVLRVFEGVLVLLRVFGVSGARVAKGDLPYTQRAVQIGQPANAVTDMGDFWEFSVPRMLPAVRTVIQRQGVPPL